MAELIKRRTYLIMQAVMVAGADIWIALEAVASTAIEHPEWDMAEEHTYEEWQKLIP